MSTPSPDLVCLLGPQRHDPDLGASIRELGLAGPFAVISAGWEEREPETEELEAHLARQGAVRNLHLFKRTEEVFARDPELLAGLKGRYDDLRCLTEVNRLRLSHALEAARSLMARPEPRAKLAPEIEASIDAIHQIDDHFVKRAAEVRAEWEDKLRLAERAELVRHREAVGRELQDCSTLLIAGGHVGILRNRLELLAPLQALGALPIVAWSAGAMVLSERIVLFHDSPAQGPGDPEVFESGFEIVKGLVCLPRASQRLRLDDETRVELFARRFAPARCVTLDPGASVVLREGKAPEFGAGTQILMSDGSVQQAAEAEVAA